MVPNQLAIIVINYLGDIPKNTEYISAFITPIEG